MEERAADSPYGLFADAKSLWARARGFYLLALRASNKNNALPFGNTKQLVLLQAQEIYK